MKHSNPIIIMLLLVALFSTSPVAWAQTDDGGLTIELAGQWPFHPTKAAAVDSERDLVFVGEGEQLLILDRQLSPISRFKVTASGQIGGIYYAPADNLVYAACRSDGLWIVDVSNPQAPFKAGAYKDTEQDLDIFSVAVDNHLAYLGCGLSGVNIVDVSDPGDTNLLRNIDLYGAMGGLTYAVDTIVSGGYLYVSDIFVGQHIYDVSDPNDPQPVKLLALTPAQDLFIENNFLFVSLMSGTLEIIDISKPKEITEEGITATYQNEGLANRATRVAGDTAYVAFDQAGLHVLDITDIKNPVHKPAWEYTATGAKSIALDTAENTAYITDDQIGLQKIDVADPANMTQLAEFDTPADVTAIDVAGDYAYALDDSVGDTPENEGLRIFKLTITNKAVEFNLSGFIATPGRAADVCVFTENAYVADGENGLQIINIMDKTAPELRSQVETPGTAAGVFVDSGFTYIADGGEGLSVVDTGRPASPERLASVDTAGYAGDVFVAGDFAYVADGDNGLVIIDVSKPVAPKLTGYIKTPGTAEGVTVEGNFAYVADGHEGLAIIDIANKNSPSIAASFNTDGYAEKVSITADIAYVADGENGLTAVDASDPNQPTRLSEWSYSTNGYASDVFSGYSSGDKAFLFVADGPPGVIGLRLSLGEDKVGEGIDSGGGGGSDSCFINSGRP